MVLDVITKKQYKYYGISDPDNNAKKSKLDVSEYINKEPEKTIYQLLFILNELKIEGYALTHICLDDFVVIEDNLFLQKSGHVVKLNDTFDYTSLKPEGIEFPSELLKNGNVSINATYASVALFVYYLFRGKIKTSLTEADLVHLRGSKPYYFIKNALSDDPCLIYL